MPTPNPPFLRSLPLGLACFLACSGLTEVQDGALVARASSAARVLELTSLDAEHLYYFAVEREMTALINWAPCTDPERCDGIAPNTSVEFSYSAIAFYEPGDAEAVVYWWRLVDGAGGELEPDSIRALVIDL
jgi:hypothetical protein